MLPSLTHMTHRV